MVKNVIELTERESRIINIVKAKYGLKDKSQALYSNAMRNANLNLNSGQSSLKK
jgi:hypothetical protein